MCLGTTAAFANALSLMQGAESCFTCDGEGIDVTCEPAVNL